MKCSKIPFTWPDWLLMKCHHHFLRNILVNKLTLVMCHVNCNTSIDIAYSSSVTFLQLELWTAVYISSIHIIQQRPALFNRDWSALFNRSRVAGIRQKKYSDFQKHPERQRVPSSGKYSLQPAYGDATSMWVWISWGRALTVLGTGLSMSTIPAMNNY